MYQEMGLTDYRLDKVQIGFETSFEGLIQVTLSWDIQFIEYHTIIIPNEKILEI